MNTEVKEGELIVPERGGPLAEQDPQGQISDLIRHAIDKGVDATSIEKFAALWERFEDRKAERLYNEALSAFQRECPPIHKRASGVHGAAYAPLDYIEATIRPYLAKFGLSYTFNQTERGTDSICIETVVRHKAGHKTSSLFTCTIDKSARMNDSQKDGSATSYAKRYGLVAALGISITGQDDDGAAAGSHLIDDSQAADLEALISETGTDRARFLKWAEVEQLGQLSQEKFREAVKNLEKKRRAAR
jgi:hypothetical protein